MPTAFLRERCLKCTPHIAHRIPMQGVKMWLTLGTELLNGKVARLFDEFRANRLQSRD